MRKHIANMVTGCRILGSVLLLCFPAFSLAFYSIYILCGFSDMIDGTIARKTNSASELGSKIDTIADLAFVTASFMKLLPALSIPGWLWIWGIGIVMIKLCNSIWGAVSKKQWLFPHTIANKLTGLLLFLLPLTLSFAELKYSAIPVCSVATFAAIQEGFSIAANRKHKETRSNLSA